MTKKLASRWLFLWVQFMAITEKDAKLIAQAISQTQNTSEHVQHHQWLRDEIERQVKRNKRWERVWQSAIGAAVLAIFSGLAAIGAWVLERNGQ